MERAVSYFITALACLMIVPDQAHGRGILFIAEHSTTFSWV